MRSSSGDYTYVETGQKVNIVTEAMIQYFFGKLAKRMGFFDDDGKPVNISTHKFRHNAITDRLDSGIFRDIDVMYETGHRNFEMIHKNYHHHSERDDRPVIFRGKVVENERLNALLSRPFSKQIYRLGLCSDVRNCEGSRAKCLRCEFLILKAENLEYYLKDREDWQKKYEKAQAIGTNLEYIAVCKDWIDAYDGIIMRIQEISENE